MRARNAAPNTHCAPPPTTECRPTDRTDSPASVPYLLESHGRWHAPAVTSVRSRHGGDGPRRTGTAQGEQPHHDGVGLASRPFGPSMSFTHRAAALLRSA